MGSVVGESVAWTFWVALGLTSYTYAGFLLIIALVSRVYSQEHKQGDIEPTVSLLIPAHNEADVIEEKINNSLSLDYPREKLQIRVVSDGSDDGTDEVARRYAPKGVELQRVERRGGKPNAINLAVPHCRGEILLLCDANTMFAPNVVRCLVRHFADPRVGAVTGDVRLQSSEVHYGAGEGLFFKLERWLQACESKLWTTIGVDGGMYALRKDLYVPNRTDTLIDDFVIAMNVARRGFRVIYDPQAVAVEDAVNDPGQEFRRRTRTVAGGLQSVFGGRGRPRWNQPVLWAAYLSHKVLRWLSPFVLILLLLSNAAAVFSTHRGEPSWYAYAAFLACQAAAYGLAGLGFLLARTRLPKPVSMPYYFCLTNGAALVGFFKWLCGVQTVTWPHPDRTKPVDIITTAQQ